MALKRNVLFWRQTTLLAVIGSLQPDHRQVYSHHKPLCFLASRDLTIKTINFFSFDGAEKVEDEVDVASGRCRRKNYPFIFRKTSQSHSHFRKTQCFQGLSHDCDQTVSGNNLKVYSLVR